MTLRRSIKKLTKGKRQEIAVTREVSSDSLSKSAVLMRLGAKRMEVEATSVATTSTVPVFFVPPPQINIGGD